MGYPSMFLVVPDELGFCFTQAFQSIGLGPGHRDRRGRWPSRDRLPVAALGDGGALMGVAELETVVRLGLPMVVVVYDDDAYGAEVHHFGPDGAPLDTVALPGRPTSPRSPAASASRPSPCAAATDLDAVAAWLAGDRARPLLIDAKCRRPRRPGGSRRPSAGTDRDRRRRSVVSMTARQRTPRRLPRWSDFTPLISLEKPELNPTRRRLRQALTIADLRSIARRRTPALGLRLHRRRRRGRDQPAAGPVDCSRELEFSPSILHDVSAGRHLDDHPRNAAPSCPSRSRPTGFTRLMHHEGERAVARVAERFGIPYALSTMGTTSIEDVAAAAPGGAEVVPALRVEGPRRRRGPRRPGACGRVRGVDPHRRRPGRRARLRDVRNGFSIPPALTAKTVANAAMHPALVAEPADDRRR